MRRRGKERGRLLWLWVITTSSVCLYFIGYRSQEILANVFGGAIYSAILGLCPHLGLILEITIPSLGVNYDYRELEI